MRPYIEAFVNGDSIFLKQSSNCLIPITTLCNITELNIDNLIINNDKLYVSSWEAINQNSSISYATSLEFLSIEKNDVIKFTGIFPDENPNISGLGVASKYVLLYQHEYIAEKYLIIT